MSLLISSPAYGSWTSDAVSFRVFYSRFTSSCSLSLQIFWCLFRMSISVMLCLNGWLTSRCRPSPESP